MKKQGLKCASFLIALLLWAGCSGPKIITPPSATQVEIRRTAYGVPHIKAENLRAAAFGLAYAQAEDYGQEVVNRLMRRTGTLAQHIGPQAIELDFIGQWIHKRAVETYDLLDPEVKEVFAGFAEGINFYTQTYPEKFSEGVPVFTPQDIAARDVAYYSTTSVDRFLTKFTADSADANLPKPDPDEGSNTWALAPSRTASGHAILVRNPHLRWSAGYYEAHLTVPGVLNFYGDYRIGGPFSIIGGFNDHLGWSTTNNSPDVDEIYGLRLAPDQPNHYWLDGAWIPLQQEDRTVQYRADNALRDTTRTFWHTRFGPVVHRTDTHVYVIKSADYGEYLRGQQFLKMMQAETLDAWKTAMRTQGITRSNFTYADDAGNIFYVWNAALPMLPHPPGQDDPIYIEESRQVWSQRLPFDQLPQLLNPPGGYLQNANDPPHYTNLHAIFRPLALPRNVPAPRLRLRSQLSLELIRDTTEILTLEDVIVRKHNMRMLIADRLKPDLITALEATNPMGGIATGLDVLKSWKNDVSAESVGSVLFQTWLTHQVEGLENPLFREPWNPEAPLATPHGLHDPERGVATFAEAVAEVLEKYGRLDVPWGEVYRVQHGNVDVPVGGCSGLWGCFRVLAFRDVADHKYAVSGGDGWVLAVEFGETPRAYSVLAYGQTNDPTAPHYADQAELFARNTLKPVAFTEADIAAQLIRTYRPGDPPLLP